MGTPLLQLRSVTVAGRGRLRLDVDVTIDEGITAVLGPSGAGKTTLLDVLVGFLRPTSGVVELSSGTNGRLARFWSPAADGLWAHRTVSEHLRLVASADPARIEQLLDAFDLSSVATVRPGELSLGQQSRVSVARALASRARVLVLDEPLAHVDPARAAGWWRTMMAAIRESEASLVFATHDPARVLAHAESVICLDHGRVAYRGSVAELYAAPATPELANFLGPTNWIPAEEAETWTDRPAPRSVRPEQLQVQRDDASPLVVRRHLHGGPISETLVFHEQAQIERSFHHVSPSTPLGPGVRIALRLGLLLLALMLPGCISEDEQLGMTATRHRHLPAFGPRLPAPRGIAALPDDRVLVLDNAGRVLIFDAQLELEAQWMMPEYDKGRPEGACSLRDGRIAVADTHYSRVVFFDRQGTVTSTMGSRGKGPGQFLFPIKVTQDPSGNLYVAEYGANDRVQKFTEQGKWLLSFGSFGGGPEQFQRPSGLVWQDGKVFVADAVHHRIQVFTDHGEHIATIGGSKSSWTLRMPYDLCAGPEGDLYACEYGAGRVTRFTAEGRLVGRFGQVGRQPGGMRTPWGLAVMSDGRVVVADTGNRRLVEWRN